MAIMNTLGPSMLHVQPIIRYFGVHVEDSLNGHGVDVINDDGRTICTIWEGAAGEASTIACAIAQALEDCEVMA